jgi:hypothetical protein
MAAAFETDEMASADDLVAQLAAGGALTFEPDLDEEALLPGATAVAADAGPAIDVAVPSD